MKGSVCFPWLIDIKVSKILIHQTILYSKNHEAIQLISSESHVLRILRDIIYADGRVDIRETELFEKLKQELCITAQLQEDVQNRSALLALYQVRSLESEQKRYLVELMRSMIVVDEDIDSHEVVVYDLVCDVIGSERLPPPDVVGYKRKRRPLPTTHYRVHTLS